jgi:hypothetical protein
MRSARVPGEILEGEPSGNFHGGSKLRGTRWVEKNSDATLALRRRG